MGRTTTPLRQLVDNYVERLKRVSTMLSRQEREAVLEFLSDLDNTASILSHEGVVDPLEVFLVHLLRKLGRGCFKES